MDGLKKLINRHLAEFPEFDYYLPIIEKAEKNEIPHPDICIECCNSLIQGTSKTIIIRLDNGNRKELDSYKTDKLIKRALKAIATNDNFYEEDFVRRSISLALPFINRLLRIMKFN
ncbi:hypothetical protein MNBD_CHLOROFLEXI01-3647 [hydrothermal vent metagenome]|uniref:Uncharacterized protein n=1 Tax=hydrothermal vent metagenome TaxID=652676 RepID=A0A3B0UMC1_9ZZZZ